MQALAAGRGDAHMVDGSSTPTTGGGDGDGISEASGAAGKIHGHVLHDSASGFEQYG